MKKLVVIFAIGYQLLAVGFSAKAQVWSAMDIGLYMGSAQIYVDALAEYDNTVFAGGEFTNAGNIFDADNIAQWDGTRWDTIAHNYVIGNIYALQVYDGNLITGGFQYPHLSQWNGTKWSEFGPDTSFFIKPNNFGPSIYAMTIYNGHLIAGGAFDSIPGLYANNIAYWDGVKWDTLGTGFTGTNHRDTTIGISALAVYNSNLYAGGYFDSAGGKPASNIAMWNGTVWSPLGAGVKGFVYALAVYNGELYVGGEFDSAGGVSAHDIAKWNGTSWDSLEGKMNCPYPKYNSPGVDALTSYNGNLYAGGYFDTIGGVAANSIAYWNGSSWHAIGKGIVGAVYTIYGSNNTLYAGGWFDTAGGVPALNIAMCSSPTGINEISNSDAFKVYPNPSNGVFTIAYRHTELVSASQTIEVYNTLGQQVLTEALRTAQNDNSINMSREPNGVYFYRVLQEGGELVGSGKVVIEK